MDPVERLPVIGRTGPDITMNKLALAVDIKSRLEVPKAVFEVYPWDEQDEMAVMDASVHEDIVFIKEDDE